LGKKRVVLFGRKTCGICADKEQKLKRKSQPFKYVSADSGVGKKWLDKHGIEELPALRVCETKDGKTNCYVHVGKTRKKEKK
jgi:hypothetical protein